MSDPSLTLNYTAAQLLAMVAKTEFRGFTQNDWYAWAGCESAEPLIGEFTHPEASPLRVTTLVLDGATVNALDMLGDDVDDYGGRVYELATTA